MDFVTKDNIAVEVERCLSVKLLNHMDCVLYNAVTKDDIHVLQGRPSVDKERTAAGSTVLHLACQRRSIKYCEWEVLNYECHTPWDVLQNRRSNTLSGDHTLTRIVLRRANHKRQQYLPLQDLEMEDPENGKNEKQREMEIERKYPWHVVGATRSAADSQLRELPLSVMPIANVIGK
ncbi:hypothetical protein POM88_046592 [Heracleum sosnowskyi]|uniref:Uncharacterized protein n=1 Tax=Heracleum sosnowskyi TaxID=360622 RepID=A0AAD8M7L0_9APIA|nr:hypothetical protein POM88_046592 [Heracleum sosnowskyi]